MATIFFTKQEYNEVSVSKLLNIRTGNWEKSYEVNHPPSEIAYMEKVEEALTFLKKSTILVLSIGYA